MKYFVTFCVFWTLLMIAMSGQAEKNPGVDSKPCYTSQTDMGKIVQDLTKRVNELENRVNKLEHK